MGSRVVLISGCSSGIGLSTAVLLAKDPEKRFRVYATMRNLAKKGPLEEEVKESLGDTLIIMQMDVCSEESVNQTVQEIIGKEGRIDVLFNNAGVGLLSVLECTPIETAQALFDVNYFGTLRLIKAVLPGMKAKQSGHIISNSSHLGIIGYPFIEIYCSSKFAVEGLMESLAPMLLQFNISCSSLEPGPVITPAYDKGRAWGDATLEAADQKTKAIMETFVRRFNRFLPENLQSSEEIAHWVKDIILTEKPNLRYQTNSEYGPDEVEAKLVDPTGNKSAQLIKAKFMD